MIAMNHAEIEELEIADRYLRGKLPPEDAARFEEHYLYCQECLDRLELGESMERGFKRAAGQDAARVAASRQVALLAWLARLGRSPRMAALAMAVLVVAVVPGLIGLREVRERDQALADARAALEQERQRSASGSQIAAEAARLQAELEANLRELNHEKEARATADKQLKEARNPQGVTAILYLDAERGTGEPSQRVHLSRTPSLIVLALAMEPPFQQAYRAVLRNADGKELWRGEGLRLNGSDLTLSLPSTLLVPGDYTVSVAGRRFPFRVLPPA